MKVNAPEPRIVFFELTRNCNLKCRHCRAEAGDHYEKELSTTEIRSIIDNISSYASPLVILTGGEPLFRNDIFEIADYLKSKQLPVALATNGTLINNSIAEKILAHNIRRVSVSIDGASSESHDKFRGIPGCFDQTLAAIKTLEKHKIPIQINVSITKSNAGEISQIIELAEKLKATALHLFVLVPVGCGISISKEEQISKEKYEELLTWFYQKSQETSLEFKVTCAPHYNRIISQQTKQTANNKSSHAHLTKGCLAGSGVCFISYQGDIQPCGYLPLKVGNVLSESFKNIWEDSIDLRRLRNTNSLTGKCGLCHYNKICSGCRARAFYASGDYMGEETICSFDPISARKKLT
jgi:radical SAM protein with 4Fe4S-binding SPASM domain